jgi:hypothetical protein
MCGSQSPKCSDPQLKMPILGLLILGAEVLCVAHVVRTGRPFWWIYLIILAPLVGTIVYLGVEVLPGLYRGPTAQQVASRVVRVADPHRGVREAWRRLELSPTVENKTALAEEYLSVGQSQDAVALYREALSGIHLTDLSVMLGLARALFSLGDTAQVLDTLERLPEYNSPEGHLLYARSLEMEGRTEAALKEYTALTAYYPGQEARCRYALLLQMTGRVAEARNLFEEIRKAIDYGPRYQYRQQREWYQLAKRQLAA